MAAYREHITVSSTLGIGVGLSATWILGFSGVQGALAGCLTGIGGMLPDLDSKSGKPVREIFGLVAAAAPMLMMRRLIEWGGSFDGAMLLAVLLYVTIRYGTAHFLALVAVHRGMFHSIPAMLIAGELAFLGYKSESMAVKVLMAVGVMIGFASHLILDELYSVEWNGVRVKLNKYAGSAFKLLGKNWSANIVTYGLLFTLTFALLEDSGATKPSPRTPAPGVLRQATEEPIRIERIDLRKK